MAMRATITLELEIADSRRTPADTRARARKAAESLVAWAERLRHVNVTGATLEPDFGRLIAAASPPLQTVDYGRLDADEGGGDASTP